VVSVQLQLNYPGKPGWILILRQIGKWIFNAAGLPSLLRIVSI